VNENCFLPPPDSPGKTWDFDRKQDREYILSQNGTNFKGYPFSIWVHHAKGGILHPFLLNVTKANGMNLTHDLPLLLSIVRQPSARFRSAWLWYGHQNSLGNITLKDFVSILTERYSLSQYIGFLSLGLYARIVNIFYSTRKKCQMSINPYGSIRFSFNYRTGLDSTFQELSGLSSESHSIELRIQYVKQLVHLMMEQKLFLFVCERFDESILIARRLLGLVNLGDSKDLRNLLFNNDSMCHNQRISNLMLYFHQKKQSHTAIHSSTKSDDDKDVMATLDRLQPFDSALYYAANVLLDRYISLYNVATPKNTSAYLKDLHHYREQLRVTHMHCNRFTRCLSNDKIRLQRKPT